METKDIVVNSLNQEFIPYHHPEWQHSMLYTVICQTNLKYIPLHWHPDLQFIVVEKGKISLVIGGNNEVISKGEGAFINSGIIHEIHPKTHDATFICWNIGIEMFDAYIQHHYIQPLIKEKNLPFILLTPKIRNHEVILQSIFTAFFNFRGQAQGFELIVTSQYLICLKHIIKIMPAQSESNRLVYDPRVKKILKFIHENYHQQITLETLANISFLSQSETIRLFKKHVGKTPFNYILTYRLEYSIEFLMNTESTISEIAHQCGFSSVSYYIKKFKENYHTTPKNYRNNNEKS